MDLYDQMPKISLSRIEISKKKNQKNPAEVHNKSKQRKMNVKAWVVVFF